MKKLLRAPHVDIIVGGSEKRAQPPRYGRLSTTSPSAANKWHVDHEQGIFVVCVGIAGESSTGAGDSREGLPAGSALARPPEDVAARVLDRQRHVRGPGWRARRRAEPHRAKAVVPPLPGLFRGRGGRSYRCTPPEWHIALLTVDHDRVPGWPVRGG